MFFRSEEDVRQWCAERNRGVAGLIPLKTAWNLATAWYHDRLNPDWKRPAIPQIRALFDRLALTGPAWELPS